MGNNFVYHDAVVALIVLSYLVLALRGKLPSVEAIQEFASVINSKGGNILWLGFFTLLFFSASVSMFYWAMNRIIEGKLTPDNAVLMMGLQFVTGVAFGGSFASMLKVMSGENPSLPPGTTITEKTASVTSTAASRIDPEPPPPIAPSPSPANATQAIPAQANAILENKQKIE